MGPRVGGPSVDVWTPGVNASLRKVSESLPPDLPGGVAGALGTLRHALSDPLSAAGMKLELLERRLAALPADGPALAERVRGAKADLAIAGRLVDLLPRLASIAGESPAETSIGELCRAAGVPLESTEASRGRILLKRRASADALRILVGFVRSVAPDGRPAQVRAEAGPGWVSLRIEAPGALAGTDDGRLFQLPRGQEQGEELFLARACVESDGGRLHLAEQEGRLAAVLSWPLPAAGEAGAPA